MIEILIKFSPKFKDWAEKPLKNKILNYLKLFIVNDLVKIAFFIIFATVMGILSNLKFFDTETFVWISIWFGWVPIFVILLPYLIYGLIIWPLSNLIEKIQNK